MLLNDIHGMKMNVICLFKAKRNWIETERETERERERERERQLVGRGMLTYLQL